MVSAIKKRCVTTGHSIKELAIEADVPYERLIKMINRFLKMSVEIHGAIETVLCKWETIEDTPNENIDAVSLLRDVSYYWKDKQVPSQFINIMLKINDYLLRNR